MGTMIIIAAVLAGLLLFTEIRLLALKAQMRKIKHELKLTRSMDYNRMLTISLFDRDLTDMTAEMNRNLEFQKRIKLEAERSEQQLKQSVSDIAHDLRTPLTVIKGNLQLLEIEEQLSPHGMEQLRLCRKKTDEIKNMADDFFELSVLESDSTAMQLGSVNVTNLLVQLLVDNEAVIRTKGLSPDVRLPEHSVFAEADEQLLLRMLENLLNNVLKYAQDSFAAEVKETAENRCRIIFSNEVRGAMPDVSRLFERTYRAGTAQGGAGLGLYIVKLLAQKQHGTVGAQADRNTLTIWAEFNTKNNFS